MKNFFQEKNEIFKEKKQGEGFRTLINNLCGYMACAGMMKNRKDVMHSDSLTNRNGGFLALMVIGRVGGQCCIQFYHLSLWLRYL